jgi:hypothetical protein
MPKIYQNGLGESQGGDVLCTQLPLFSSGNVWWVNSATGTDAGGTAGQDRERPLATLVQANTNASDYDLVVLESGHTETLVAALSLKALTIVGVGTTSGKPAAQIKINAAAASMLVFSGAAVGELRNIYFPASVQANTTANGKIRQSTSGHLLISGCYFELSANDQLPGISIDTGSTIVENCTFVSTATAIASRPLKAIGSTGAVSDVRIVGSVFDSGTVGFSTAAIDLSTAAVTRLRAFSNSFLRGADSLIHASTTGYFIPSTNSGSPKVTW